MIKYCFVFVALLLSKPLIAQDKTGDMPLVMETVENYFYGYVERDVEKLNTAFDTENGVMKMVSKTEAGKEISQNNYFKNIVPKWAAKEPLSPEVIKNCKLKILNLEIIEGRLATATLEMKIGKTAYIDVLSLQKLNNTWKITNKMFVEK